MWWATASMGLSVAGAGANYLGRREQADLMRAETDEEVRRFREEAARRVSLARATGAASGVEFESGSIQDYLGKMTTELETQAAWMKTAGYRRAGGVDRAATFGLVGDLGGAMFQYGSANNWWRAPAT